MDIVIASDNNYAAHAAALICSICENNKEDIIIHLLDGGIEEEIYNKIEVLKNRYNYLNIKRYIFTEDDIRKRIDCNLTKDRSISTYARIFIPELVDKSMDRILYLDADAIVCSSLKKLFSMDMGNYSIAGVLDVVKPEKRLKVNLDIKDKYINAGMLLWNLKRCREINIVEQFKRFIISKNGDVAAMDQGTINGTLKGNLLVLAPRWNVLTPFYQLSSYNLKRLYHLNYYYNQSELDSSVSSPVFIHFVPNYTSRPWCRGCRHPLKNEYLKYRNMTEFGMEKLEKDNRKLKIKLIGWLFYLLPYSIFQKL
ncbi:MAG: glycosyltransferase family 8 protein [Bacillota bacterium]|nr:glycosyltransferase family 8 protein [Bacillota bacterium]